MRIPSVCTRREVIVNYVIDSLNTTTPNSCVSSAGFRRTRWDVGKDVCAAEPALVCVVMCAFVPRSACNLRGKDADLPPRSCIIFARQDRARPVCSFPGRSSPALRTGSPVTVDVGGGKKHIPFQRWCVDDDVSVRGASQPLRGD